MFAAGGVEPAIQLLDVKLGFQNFFFRQRVQAGANQEGLRAAAQPARPIFAVGHQSDDRPQFGGVRCSANDQRGRCAARPGQVLNLGVRPEK
eukprot:2921267-Lingulodinium_polyedra.AAC.1